MKQPTTILGIDPGTVVSGYAVIRSDDRRTVAVDYGYLQMKSGSDLVKRVGQFHTFYEEKVQTHGVSHLAIETPFLGKNPSTFLKLGYLRGILYLLANTHDLVLSEFSPREVKSSVTGYGGATKEQVALMVSRMFVGLGEIKNTAKQDVTDALAVSLCGLWHAQRPAVLR